MKNNEFTIENVKTKTNNQENVIGQKKESSSNIITNGNETSKKDIQESINKIKKEIDLYMDSNSPSVQVTTMEKLEKSTPERDISLEKKNYDNLSDIFLDSIAPDNAILSKITKKQVSKNEYVYTLNTIYEDDTFDFTIHASKKSLWLDYLFRNGSIQTAKKDHIPMELMSKYLQQMLLYCAQQQPNIKLIQFAPFKGDKQFDVLTRPEFAKRQAEKRASLFMRLLSNALGQNKTSVVFEKDLFQRMPNAIIYDMYLKDDRKYKQYINKFKNLFNSFLHI